LPLLQLLLAELLIEEKVAQAALLGRWQGLCSLAI
jgi:hypothetical protein